MHVVGNRPHVVEELRIDRPTVVLVENALADQIGAPFGDGLPEQELLAFEQAKTESFVPDSALVGRLGGAAKPTLIDAAAIGSESIVVVRDAA